MKNNYAIIMAGGIGSRFWPLSTHSRPKQFLDIPGTGETLIQQTFNRFRTLCPVENILVITNEEHKELVKQQLDISEEKILTEPLRKNTAPCIAYGTYKILKENEDALIVVSPADHIISRQTEFEEVIRNCFAFARTNQALITMGIRPDKPETGYGYILADKKSPVTGTDHLFKVKSFTEKPDIRLARKFLKSGDYFWNSGIFIWSARSVLKAFDQYLPDVSAAFKENLQALGTPEETQMIKRIYPGFDAVSIDYGIMEKAGNVYVITAEPGWSDLGTWSSLYAHSACDDDGNAIVRGRAHVFDSKGNLISVTSGKKVLIQGLQDYVVVETEDALLIVRKQDEQKIKDYLGIIEKSTELRK